METGGHLQFENVGAMDSAQLRGFARAELVQVRFHGPQQLLEAVRIRTGVGCQHLARQTNATRARHHGVGFHRPDIAGGQRNRVMVGQSDELLGIGAVVAFDRLRPADELERVPHLEFVLHELLRVVRALEALPVDLEIR